MTRTAGDQWDIVSSVGFTALLVAAFRALETTRQEPLVRDEYARPFVDATGEPRLAAQLADVKPESDWDTGLQIMVNYFAVRTKYFDEFFAQAKAAGIRQVVILAAGLDSRSYRLDWADDTVVYELDQPKVLDFKRDALAAQNAQASADRREVAADLRDDWVAALKAQGFDATKPTAWLAEGLLIYLPGAAQDALFETITANSAPGSFLATEWRGNQANSKQWQMLIDALNLNFMADTKISDLTYHDERADPVDWLAEHGWNVTTKTRLDQANDWGRPVPDEYPEIAGYWADTRFINATKP